MPAWAGAPNVRYSTKSGEETLMLTLPGARAAKIFTLEHPNRLVIDVPALSKAEREAITLPAKHGKLITSLRTGQFDAHTTRIVLELASAPENLNSRVKTGAQTVITVSFGKAVAESEAKPQAKTEKTAKSNKTLSKRMEKSGKDAEKNRIPIGKATQDERPTVVIDAGHGGPDPGTTGAAGTLEKDVVLEYARALKAALTATGRYKVFLTRADNHFILLRQRVELARKARGTVFISLHADSAPDDVARGLSVYTLSEKASDAESAALAERENQADAIYNLDLSTQSKDVADILVSLAQRDTNARSAQFADGLLTALHEEEVQLLAANTHRYAGFAVLKAPDIPSVLVELGFLSNSAEEKQLQNKTYRAKIITGLTAGIDAFFAQGKN